MKPVKHFVKQVRVDKAGRVIQTVVLTPPLDTQAQAEDYAAWYDRESVVRRCVQDKMMASTVGYRPTDFTTIVFETTLY